MAAAAAAAAGRWRTFVCEPVILPQPSKWTVTSLRKRLELLLRSVFALPNASSTGFR